MQKSDELNENEMLMMKVLWDNRKPMSIRQIADKLKKIFGLDLSLQKAAVFLGHIFKKGYLHQSMTGTTAYFFPLITEDAYHRGMAARYQIDPSHPDFGSFAICEPVDDRERSYEDYQRIKRMIDELE